jgi:hypothetical protein
MHYFDVDAVGSNFLSKKNVWMWVMGMQRQITYRKKL